MHFIIYPHMNTHTHSDTHIHTNDCREYYFSNDVMKTTAQGAAKEEVIRAC